jgi:O-antigen ligase
MNLTSAIWLSLYVSLAGISMVRAVWGVSLYVMCYLIMPPLWWWGQGWMQPLRWNYYAGIILLVAVIKEYGGLPVFTNPDVKRTLKILALMVLNATAVHFLLSPERTESQVNYMLMLKFSLLCVLITAAVRSTLDLRILLLSIVLSLSYIGYQVTFNDAGSMRGGRLENVGAAGASDANHLASLVATILPLAGAVIFLGGRNEKLIAVAAAALSLNLLLLCNSRGAFLALLTAGGFLFLIARGKARRKAFTALALAGLAGVVFMGDARILDRFFTSFNDAEERDDSAAGRLELWGAGLNMIRAYPLGSGGFGFKRVRGERFLKDAGRTESVRAIHNGYITDGCEWGVQGAFLRLAFFASGVFSLWRAMLFRVHKGDDMAVFFAACIMSALVTFMVSSMFGDVLDAEWGYWVIAVMLIYASLYGPEGASQREEEEQTSMASAWEQPLELTPH